MSVIFDALQKSEQWTNQVKKSATTEGIVTNEGVPKRIAVILFITLLLLIMVNRVFFSNVNVSTSSLDQLELIETRLTIDDTEPSLVVSAPKYHPEVAVVEKIEKQHEFESKGAVEPAREISTLQQPVVPLVKIVNTTQPIGSTMASRSKPLSLNETKQRPVHEAKTNVIESNIVEKKATSNEINREKISEKNVDSPPNVGFIVNQIKSTIRSGNAEKLDVLFSSLEQQTSIDSIIVLRLRGYAMLMQNNNIEAKSVYENLLHQYPDDLEANLNMVLLEVRLGESSQAIARLYRLRSLYPDSTEVTRYLNTLEVRS